MTPELLENLEVRLLLEGIRSVYGYDFRDYAEASLQRRIRHWLAENGFASPSAAQEVVLRERAVFTSFLDGVTINVSEMFRDPRFFRTLRDEVFPELRTWPFVKIWIAGCAGGEEAYSLAILLHEAGMLQRCRIYATDINERVLDRARSGIFALRDMRTFTRNYQLSGGSREFSDYYCARYDSAMLLPLCKERILFVPHNLAVDADFGEMHLILCRNVMIYFKAGLKERVVGLFNAALVPGGFLCLGLKESLETRSVAPHYRELRAGTRIYRRSYDA